ncbi:MAG: metalloregulator ArsR/SmtB family transcription factor [Acidobacteriota bacterium]
MNKKNFKSRLYRQFSKVGKALANPCRLELLDLLAQGEKTVEALAKEIAQSIANTSHHLQVLREACLVEGRKEGLYVYYRLTDTKVYQLNLLIHSLAEQQIADVDRLIKIYFNFPDRLEPIKRQDLLEKIRSGTVLVLDVRPDNEYRFGHIPGAVSIPLDRLEKTLQELPNSREVIAYCRGRYCVMSHQAVELMRTKGISARRLEDGFPEWRAAGLPIEVAIEEQDYDL